MPLFRVTDDALKPVPPTTFAAAELYERSDLQRLLRDHFDAIDDGVLILAEEFGEWASSARRIDLLGVDRDARLVVIELKRTDDGGHMELQAIRYAAMVSQLSYTRAVETFDAYLRKRGDAVEEGDAEARMLEWLGWDEPAPEQFGNAVRIVLVSQDFSKELTTAALWLNEQGLDLSCVRIKPYEHEGTVLIDVQPVIPLPEASAYMESVREKRGEDRKERGGQAERDDLRLRFWTALLFAAKSSTPLHATITAGPGSYAASGTGTPPGFRLVYMVGMHSTRIELFIGSNDDDQNKACFDELYAARSEIERRFGDGLEWERRDEKRGCRVVFTLEVGGYRNPERDWPAIHDRMIHAMVRFEAALRPALDALEA